MELEVGMYVRSKNGAIVKIEQIVDDEIHFNIKPIFSDGEEFDYNWLYIKDVIKASHSLLGNDKEPCLIEVGDYVNGRIVDEFIYLDKLGLIGLSELEKEDEKFIKTIVTKEQFESMAYRVCD